MLTAWKVLEPLRKPVRQSKVVLLSWLRISLIAVRLLLSRLPCFLSMISLDTRFGTTYKLIFTLQSLAPCLLLGRSYHNKFVPWWNPKEFAIILVILL